MKKLFALFTAVLLLVTVTACQGQEPAPTQPTEPSPFESDIDVFAPTQDPVPASPAALVAGDFTQEQGDVRYEGEPSEYLSTLGFTALADWQSFTFCQLSLETETYTVSQELFSGQLQRGQLFVAQVTFWGDMTTYGLNITDANGDVRHYAVSVSGMDGSLILEEYTAQ